MRCPKVCAVPGCGEDAASAKTGRCVAHQEAPWVRSRRDERTGPKFRANRRRALKETLGRCVFCGEQASEVDHRRPVAWGGGDELDNLQPMCSTHHRIKTADESVLGARVARGVAGEREIVAHVRVWTPQVGRWAKLRG